MCTHCVICVVVDTPLAGSNPTRAEKLVTDFILLFQLNLETIPLSPSLSLSRSPSLPLSSPLSLPLSLSLSLSEIYLSQPVSAIVCMYQCIVSASSIDCGRANLLPSPMVRW